MSFLAEFFRDPFTVGAIAPSSSGLARMATVAVPRTGSPVIVELGPGTGAFTAAIQQRLGGRGRHIAIEVNPRFAQLLAARYPGADVVNADAADLSTVLAQRGLGGADVVVSGLPWAAFGEGLQRDVLSAVVAALPPHGVFTTFAYVHTRWTIPARRLLRAVRSLFDEVVVSGTEWSNLPPALVYYCRRPLPTASRAAIVAAQPGQSFLGATHEQFVH
ncbi:SAM-dependent methyltransferase [Micromonospora sp. NPDC005979]|uniref:class I SAM-dependent methyltransferase n=1 Tax=Micromonospora sp. NPDC005979 TaxID=3156726 RepID=UPI0033B5E8BD